MIETKKIKKAIRKKRVIYLIIASIMGFQVIEKSTALSKKFADYEKMFFQKETCVFNDHKNSDHAIDTKNIDFPYEPLYNLSIPKLQTLREYLDDVLFKK